MTHPRSKRVHDGCLFLLFAIHIEASAKTSRESFRSGRLQGILLQGKALSVSKITGSLCGGKPVFVFCLGRLPKSRTEKIRRDYR